MVINHDLTEQQMKDAYQAIRAIQMQKGKTEQQANSTANDLVYAAFRNLITYESLINSINDGARRAFNGR